MTRSRYLLFTLLPLTHLRWPCSGGSRFLGLGRRSRELTELTELSGEEDREDLRVGGPVANGLVVNSPILSRSDIDAFWQWPHMYVLKPLPLQSSQLCSLNKLISP